MLKLEREVREYLGTLKQTRPKNKAEIRSALLVRKLDNLRQRRATLKRSEVRALRLMGRVDYTKIKPSIVPVTTKKDRALWTYCRHILSSAPWAGRPGRSNYFFCVDDVSGGLLGIVDFSGDLAVLGPRDDHIGWKSEQKYKRGGINRIGAVGTCVSVAPFGWLTGGKFQMMATCTEEFVRFWRQRYDDPLAAVTTTSLYGKSSIYNRLEGGSIPDEFPDVKYLGSTPGGGIFHIDAAGYDLFLRFLAENQQTTRPSGASTLMGGKWNALIAVAGHLRFDLESIKTYQPRGVYMAELGVNALDFLRMNTLELQQELPTIRDVSKWWLGRWYEMRLPKQVDRIRSFDVNMYQVDRQIDYCRRRADEYKRLKQEEARP